MLFFFLAWLFSLVLTLTMYLFCSLCSFSFPVCLAFYCLSFSGCLLCPLSFSLSFSYFHFFSLSHSFASSFNLFSLPFSFFLSPLLMFTHSPTLAISLFVALCLFLPCLSQFFFFFRLIEKKEKALRRLEEQLKKLELQETDREENKVIALGTSKLNYLDPRISVAW